MLASLWQRPSVMCGRKSDASFLKPYFFNSNHSESNLEGRSDDKGPEPENLTIGQVKVLGRNLTEAKERGLKMLDRVGLLAHKDKFPGG